MRFSEPLKACHDDDETRIGSYYVSASNIRTFIANGLGLGFGGIHSIDIL